MCRIALIVALLIAGPAVAAEPTPAEAARKAVAGMIHHNMVFAGENPGNLGWRHIGGTAIGWDFAVPGDRGDVIGGYARTGVLQYGRVAFAVCGTIIELRSMSFRIDSGAEKVDEMTPLLAHLAEYGVTAERLPEEPYAGPRWRLSGQGRRPAILHASERCVGPDLGFFPACWTTVSVVRRGDFAESNAGEGEICLPPEQRLATNPRLRNR